jgi:predicted nucleotidyltransferase
MSETSITAIQNEAFLTGSFAYGTPHKDSDIDIVVKMSDREIDNLREAEEELHTLTKKKKPKQSDKDYYTANSFRFGNLNIITLSDELEFKAWQLATENLKARSPVTRKKAVKCFKKYLKKLAWSADKGKGYDIRDLFNEYKNE